MGTATPQMLVLVVLCCVGCVAGVGCAGGVAGVVLCCAGAGGVLCCLVLCCILFCSVVLALCCSGAGGAVLICWCCLVLCCYWCWWCFLVGVVLRCVVPLLVVLVWKKYPKTINGTQLHKQRDTEER